MKNRGNILLLFVLTLLIGFGSCSKSDDKDFDDLTDQDKKDPEDEKEPEKSFKAFDDFFIVEENSKAGEANQIDVSINDKKGDDAKFALATEAKNGAVTEIGNGVFEYVPNPQFIGLDSFTYTLSNGKGEQQSTATVNVKVVPRELTAEVFENIDPNFPSFVSVRNTTPAGKKWVKLESMSDEFETWDDSKWFKSIWHYDPPVFMSRSSENSGVSDGHLWIKATLNESNPEGRWFQTSRIHSRTKIKYPIYTEARIKTASISAFNTYWMNDGNSLDRDEIDIIENNSNPSCGCQPDFPWLMKSNYHHADAELTPGAINNPNQFSNKDLSKNNPLRGVRWNEAYHTYGVWWKDSKNIEFYLNGEPAGSVVVGYDRRTNKTYPEREFTRDLQIIFDLWTKDADWLGGLPDKSELGNDAINTMRVDWVRTWALEDE